MGEHFYKDDVDFDNTLVKCHHEYKAQQPDELSLNVNDIIQVASQEYPTWWVGNNLNTNESGWFPSNFVMPVSGPPVAKKTEEIEKVKAVYHYEAQAPDEISLQKGDIIQVLEKAEGWWKGVNNGNIGLFPENFAVPYSQQEEETPKQPPSKELPLNPTTSGPPKKDKPENDNTEMAKKGEDRPSVESTSHDPSDPQASSKRSSITESFKLAAYGVKKGGLGGLFSGGISGMRKSGSIKGKSDSSSKDKSGDIEQPNVALRQPSASSQDSKNAHVEPLTNIASIPIKETVQESPAQTPNKAVPLPPLPTQKAREIPKPSITPKEDKESIHSISESPKALPKAPVPDTEPSTESLKSKEPSIISLPEPESTPPPSAGQLQETESNISKEEEPEAESVKKPSPEEVNPSDNDTSNPIIAEVIEDYEAQSKEELSFSSGDTLTVLEQEEELWKGDCHGKIGYFPPHTVKIIKQEKPKSSSEDEPKAAFGIKKGGLGGLFSAGGVPQLRRVTPTAPKESPSNSNSTNQAFPFPVNLKSTKKTPPPVSKKPSVPKEINKPPVPLKSASDSSQSSRASFPQPRSEPMSEVDLNRASQNLEEKPRKPATRSIPLPTEQREDNAQDDEKKIQSEAKSSTLQKTSTDNLSMKSIPDSHQESKGSPIADKHEEAKFVPQDTADVDSIASLDTNSEANKSFESFKSDLSQKMDNETPISNSQSGLNLKRQPSQSSITKLDGNSTSDSESINNLSRQLSQSSVSKLDEKSVPDSISAMNLDLKTSQNPISNSLNDTDEVIMLEDSHISTSDIHSNQPSVKMSPPSKSASLSAVNHEAHLQSESLSSYKTAASALDSTFLANNDNNENNSGSRQTSKNPFKTGSDTAIPPPRPNRPQSAKVSTIAPEDAAKPELSDVSPLPREKLDDKNIDQRPNSSDSNLDSNAIKMSKENSVITLEKQESDDVVQGDFQDDSRAIFISEDNVLDNQVKISEVSEMELETQRLEQIKDNDEVQETQVRNPSDDISQDALDQPSTPSDEHESLHQPIEEAKAPELQAREEIEEKEGLNPSVSALETLALKEPISKLTHVTRARPNNNSRRKPANSRAPLGPTQSEILEKSLREEAKDTKVKEDVFIAESMNSQKEVENNEVASETPRSRLASKSKIATPFAGFSPGTPPKPSGYKPVLARFQSGATPSASCPEIPRKLGLNKKPEPSSSGEVHPKPSSSSNTLQEKMREFIKRELEQMKEVFDTRLNHEIQARQSLENQVKELQEQLDALTQFMQ